MTADNAIDTRYASHYLARRIPAEVLADAIDGVTGVPETYPGYPAGLRAMQLPGPQIDSYFLSLFGRSVWRRRLTLLAGTRTARRRGHARIRVS